jgi:hypothetical protein
LNQICVKRNCTIKGSPNPLDERVVDTNVRPIGVVGTQAINLVRVPRTNRRSKRHEMMDELRLPTDTFDNEFDIRRLMITNESMKLPHRSHRSWHIVIRSFPDLLIVIAILNEVGREGFVVVNEGRHDEIRVTKNGDEIRRTKNDLYTF